MRSRENIASAKEARLMDTEELRAYTSLGRNNAIKFGEKIEAKVKIGRRVLWDRKKVDQYFDSLTGVKTKAEITEYIQGNGPARQIS